MERIEQLRNLVVMALADGSLGEDELLLLAQRCTELGLGEDQLRGSIRFALGDDAALRLPEDEADKEALLTDLLRMMAADGQLSESEKRLFALAAAKMNYVGETLDRLITRITSE